MSTNNTPGNTSFKDLVEADKKSILEDFLNLMFPDSKSTMNNGPASGNEKNANEKNGGTTLGTQASEMSDYDLLFGDDIDDIDELFEDILKRAKEEFNKHEEFKTKYPDIQILKDIFKKPQPKKARNTKKKVTTKAIDNSLAIMNNFKKMMVDPSEQLPQMPSTNLSHKNDNSFHSSMIQSVSKDYNQFKSSIKTLTTEENQPQKRPYPIWKSTETYTPVFSAITNPNWANLHSNSIKAKRLCTPSQKKLYTPRHISGWMDTATTSSLTEPPSCKSVRSDVAVHDSDSDDEDNKQSIENTSIYFSPEYSPTATTPTKDLSIEYKTPMKNTLTPSTPLKSTTVRFRPSPPEYFVYGSDGNSSISSNDPIFAEANEFDRQIDSPKNYNDFDQDSIQLQDSPLYLQNESPPYKESIECEYEEHHHIFSNKTVDNNIQKNMSNDAVQNPMFEDFVRKLNDNISNNYKMELKCSMKVKYYK